MNTEKVKTLLLQLVLAHLGTVNAGEVLVGSRGANGLTSKSSSRSFRSSRTGTQRLEKSLCFELGVKSYPGGIKLRQLACEAAGVSQVPEEHSKTKTIEAAQLEWVEANK